MTLGDLRSQLGVPQAEVAARLGLTLTAVAALDAVRVADASGSTLALWAAGLGGALEVALPSGRRVRLG